MEGWAYPTYAKPPVGRVLRYSPALSGQRLLLLRWLPSVASSLRHPQGLLGQELPLRPLTHLILTHTSSS